MAEPRRIHFNSGRYRLLNRFIVRNRPFDGNIEPVFACNHSHPHATLAWQEQAGDVTQLGDPLYDRGNKHRTFLDTDNPVCLPL